MLIPLSSSFQAAICSLLGPCLHEQSPSASGSCGYLPPAQQGITSTDPGLFHFPFCSEATFKPPSLTGCSPPLVFSGPVTVPHSRESHSTSSDLGPWRVSPDSCCSHLTFLYTALLNPTSLFPAGLASFQSHAHAADYNPQCSLP